MIPTTKYPLIIDCIDRRSPLKLTKLAHPATSWMNDWSIRKLQLKSYLNHVKLFAVKKTLMTGRNFEVHKRCQNISRSTIKGLVNNTTILSQIQKTHDIRVVSTDLNNSSVSMAKRTSTSIPLEYINMKQ